MPARLSVSFLLSVYGFVQRIQAVPEVDPTLFFARKSTFHTRTFRRGEIEQMMADMLCAKSRPRRRAPEWFVMRYDVHLTSDVPVSHNRMLYFATTRTVDGCGKAPERSSSPYTYAVARVSVALRFACL